MPGAEKTPTEQTVRPEWLAVGQRLEMARNLLGLTQREFLASTGISEPHYTGVKKGIKGLTLDKAHGLKRVHGLSLDWIFDGDTGMNLQMARALQTMMQAREHHAAQLDVPTLPPRVGKPR